MRALIEKISTFARTHSRAVEITVGLFALATLAFFIFTYIPKNKGDTVEEPTASQEVTSEDVVQDVQGDVLETISFENIPDEAFVPPADGKVIRVNILKGEVRRYENGTLVGETMRMVARPRKGTYWETPGGLYHISNKDENYYSEKAGAYLPYSIHLFGNYIIHGIPNNGKGRIYTSSFLNGGIRLSDANAKELYLWSDPDTRVSIFSDSVLRPEQLYTGSVYITENGSSRPRLGADAYIIGDIDTGDIILEKNKDKVFPLASLTKLITLLVALDKENPFETIKVSGRALSAYGTSGFRVGEEVEMANVVYPLLLQSSNDAAEILAEYVGRNEFLKLMNEKAKSLGMINTFFDDPSGLSANNKTSASDLFKLAQHITKEKSFIWKITGKKSYSAQGHIWRNINQFLRLQGHVGGKSGQTDEARQTNVEVFSLPLGEGKTRNIAIIVLHTPDRYNDTIRLYNYVKKNVTFGRDGLFKFTSNPEENKEVVLSFLGDTMLDRGVKFSVKKNFAGDYMKLFTHMAKLKESDFAFINLEGPASDKGTDLKNLYSFRMEPKVLDTLKEAGVDVINVANNHIADWGTGAFTDTIARIRGNGLQAVGGGFNRAEAIEPVIVEKEGMKIGYLGFSDVGPSGFEAEEKKPGILYADDPEFNTIVANAKKKVDFLVVSFHWGTEYAGVTRRQTELAHKAIDAGANMIVGHNPHVVQETELYKGGVIAYSLGNFIFDQNFSKEVSQGLMVEVTLDVKQKRIKRFDKFTITQDKDLVPSEPKPFGEK